MSKCITGFERSAHVVNVRLNAGDVVTFKAPVTPGQSAVEVMRRGVAARREALLERSALDSASEAFGGRLVPVGLDQESFGQMMGGWLKKIIG